MEKIIWEMQEAGWYTSELGSIVRERTGWVFYPEELFAPPIGPYKTLKEAKAEAERSLT